MKAWTPIIVCALWLSCTAHAEDVPKLRVVATTTILADLAKSVGGDHVDVHALLEPDMDPHAFEPTPRDVVRMADADLVFANGLGLEPFLAALGKSRAAKMHIVRVAEGLDGLLPMRDDHGHDHGDYDPHIWFDPNMVLRAIAAMREALSSIDPQHAHVYTENQRKLADHIYVLDIWVQNEIRKIPEGARQVVCDHQVLAYFCKRYGVETVGVLVEGGGSLASPSARNMARIIESIRASEAKAILVGSTVNPKLAQRIASDSGARVVRIYTDALSAEGGPAADYLSFMRYNVTAICAAMRGDAP